MRILVVDDHPMMAEALTLAMRTLEGTPDVEIAGNLTDAIERASRTSYDLCLLDPGLPNCAGLEALSRMRASLPALPVVVVSGNDDSAIVLEALDLGAMGYIPKTSPRDVLLGAVRLVACGGIYVPVGALKSREAQPARPSPAAAAASELAMSVRQREVLDLLLKGLPNKLIARRLNISENTAKIHVSAVLRVLGVANRTQALIAANRLGLRLDS